MILPVIVPGAVGVVDMIVATTESETTLVADFDLILYVPVVKPVKVVAVPKVTPLSLLY